MPFSEELQKKSYDNTQNRKSTDYLKFTEQYRSIGRVLDTQARTVWKHFIPQANKGKGMSAVCPNVRADMSVCPLEASVKGLPKDSQERKDKVARRRFIVNVLDRTPHTVCESCGTNTPQLRTKECISCGHDLSKAKFKPLNKVKIMEGGVKLFNQSLNPIADMQAQDYQREDGTPVDISDYDITFTTGTIRSGCSVRTNFN
jgi:ribosomal protein L37E